MSTLGCYKRLFLVLLAATWLGLNPAIAQRPVSSALQQPQGCSPTVSLNAQGLPDMDCGTLDILIRHDSYTIGLLQQLLGEATRPELRGLIQQMLHDHEQEMAKLNKIRKDWYGQSLNQTK